MTESYRIKSNDISCWHEFSYLILKELVILGIWGLSAVQKTVNTIDKLIACQTLRVYYISIQYKYK